MVEEAGQDFDVEVAADRIIERLALTAGQVVWIWASSHSLDLIEALAYRIRERGAFWTLRLTLEPLLRRIGLGVSEPYLGLIPEHELRWLDDIDAIVELRDHGGFVPAVPPVRRRAMAAEWIALIDAAQERGCRRLTVVNPTPALAAAQGLPVAKLRRHCRQALMVDDGQLVQRQRRLATRLAVADQVRITSAADTDLQLRIGGRPIYTDDGSLPFGEVYVAPLEETAEGVAIIDLAFIQGRPVEQLRLTFVQGRLVHFSAPDPAAVTALETMLASAAGDKDCIAEFACGLNPGLTEPIGYSALDEKIGGSVHIAVGRNVHFGGCNRSNLHVDWVMLRPTVWLDGEPILQHGEWMEKAES